MAVVFDLVRAIYSRILILDLKNGTCGTHFGSKLGSTKGLSPEERDLIRLVVSGISKWRFKAL